MSGISNARNVALAAAFAALVTLPFWMPGIYYINVSSQVLFYAIFAIGLNLLVGYGGLWLAALIVTYAAGTSVLQSAYQRGDMLTAAGTTAIMTNAVPITAGFVLSGQRLPHGIRAVLQLAAFACLVASAAALGRQQTPGSEPH